MNGYHITDLEGIPEPIYITSEEVYESSEYYKVGTDYYYSKFYNQAIEFYLRVILSANNSDTRNECVALLGIAASYCQQGLYEKGEEYYYRTINLYPYCAEAYYGLALVGTKTRKNEHVEENYLQAIKYKPSYYDAYYNLGVFYIRIRKDTVKAIKYFKKSLLINEDKYQAAYNLGVVYFHLRKYVEAKDYFLRTLQINSSFYPAKVNLCLSYIYLQRYDRASEEAKKMLRIKEDDKNATNIMILSAMKSEKYQEAFKYAQDYLNKYSQDIFILTNSAIIQSQLGHNDKAIEIYEKAIKIQPHNSNVWLNLGVSYIKLQNYEAAIETLEKLIKLRTNNYMHIFDLTKDYATYELQTNMFNIWHTAGFVYAKLGKYEQAIEAYKNALRLNKISIHSWVQLGIVQIKKLFGTVFRCC